MNDGTLYPLSCQMCPAAAHSIVSHTHPQTIITNDLMVNFLRVPSLTNRLILDHPQSVHTGTHKTKTFTRHDAMRLQSWTQEMWEFIHTIGPRPRFHPLQSWVWHCYGSREAEPLSWRTTYEKKTNVLRRALRLELLFSLLWFIGSIVTSFLPVLNVPLICSSRACTWNNSLKMNEKKAKHWGLWDEREP